MDTFISLFSLLLSLCHTHTRTDVCMYTFYIRHLSLQTKKEQKRRNCREKRNMFSILVSCFSMKVIAKNAKKSDFAVFVHTSSSGKWMELIQMWLLWQYRNINTLCKHKAVSIYSAKTGYHQWIISVGSFPHSYCQGACWWNRSTKVHPTVMTCREFRA